MEEKSVYCHNMPDEAFHSTRLPEIEWDWGTFQKRYLVFQLVTREKCVSGRRLAIDPMVVETVWDQGVVHQ